MKRLLTFILLLSNSSFLIAAELDKIDIITPTSYERPSTFSQTVTSQIKVGLGDLFNKDVVAEVKKKIGPYKSKLSAYYPAPGEFDAFVNSVAVKGKDSTIGNNLTDSNLITFYSYLGTNLIGAVADKVLSTEGIKDPARRMLWVNKLLAPFQACTVKAMNALYDASHCLDALSSSLVQTIGVALTYELSRQNLSSKLSSGEQQNFNIEQTNLYKSCVRKTAGESEDVKRCALQAMKAGLLKIAEPKLTEAINKSASSNAAAKTIKQTVWPGFNQCTQKVGSNPKDPKELSDQFVDCVDNLLVTTGVQLVQDKVNNNSTIKANFSKAEIGKLAAEKAERFKTCINDQKKKNNRVDGMLDTDKCENLLTNEITYRVVLKSLSQTASETIKSNPAAINKASLEGRQLLDQCWRNEQSEKERESCLRQTILSFAQVIATLKLNDAIPDELSSKKELTKAALKELVTCLEKNLPANISEADNLNAKTNLCSNKLTVSTAQKVARELIRSKARSQKMAETDIDDLITTFVDEKFMSCIGNSPGDAVLDKCSGELKRNAALTMAASQIRLNAEGKVNPSEIEVLVSTLVNQKFSTCLGNNPSDSKLDICIGDLTKNATRAIVLSYEKKQIKEQLNADATPEKLKPVEQEFMACTDKNYPIEQVSKSLDECTKTFALGFARALGDLKFKTLMQSVLGTQEYNDQKKNIDDILSNYNKCLDDLKKISLEDGLLDKLSFCTDSLQRNGVNFVSTTVNNWMSTEEKDRATQKVKIEFASFFPCLSALIPASPYSEKLDDNVQSILKPVALLMAQYIEYSPENAKRTLDEISKKLATDLKDVASNPTSRKELIDLLYSNGALDQFLKSMVRSQVKESFDAMPESELPKALRTALLSKENFDKIFATEEGKAIKDMVMEKILKPVLMDQADLNSPLMSAGMDSIKDRVTKMLVFSPNFGDQIIKTSVQGKINDMGGISKFFAKVIYGKGSLDWEKVRLTSKGKEAEEFIRENILLPKFKGQAISAEQEKKDNEESERLVTAAVKSYE
ncbi:MAG: hypothetical protein WC635_13455 [Bacteriovorax sp.]|jgi:hypothetical protein